MRRYIGEIHNIYKAILSEIVIHYIFFSFNNFKLSPGDNSIILYNFIYYYLQQIQSVLQ